MILITSASAFFLLHVLLDSSYRNTTRKRKIAEALMIQVRRLSLSAKKTVSGVKTF